MRKRRKIIKFTGMARRFSREGGRKGGRERQTETERERDLQAERVRGRGRTSQGERRFSL